MEIHFVVDNNNSEAGNTISCHSKIPSLMFETCDVS